MPDIQVQGNKIVCLDDDSSPATVLDVFQVDITSGNVGIGTTPSSYLLDINDDNATGTGLRVTGGGGGRPIATFSRDVGSTGTIMVNAGSGDPQIRFTSASDNWSVGVDSTVFNICDGTAVGSNQRLVIDTSGNVGIGTLIPSAPLTVDGDLAINVAGDSNTSKAIVINTSGTNFESDDGIIQATHAASGSLTGGYWLKFNANSADKFTVRGDGRTEISSTTGGVILPRMTATEKGNISSPSNGEMVYDTTDNKFYGYANGAWVALH